HVSSSSTVTPHTITFSFNCSPPHPALHSFPTRRSSDLLPTASAMTIAGSSPPETTKSPIEISSGCSASRIRSSNPSYRPQRKIRSEEHTSELQSRSDLVCRLLLEKKKTI